MPIEELVVEVSFLLPNVAVKQELLQAVRNNFTLLSMKVSGSHQELGFNDDEKAQLVFYANRNQNLSKWVNNPEMLDPKVWPEALHLAEQAGPNSCYRGLQWVLGKKTNDDPIGRKRKHS